MYRVIFMYTVHKIYKFFSILQSYSFSVSNFSMFLFRLCSLWTLMHLPVSLLFFHPEQLTSNRFPEAELLTQAVSGKVSAREGVGSIGARATQVTPVRATG